MIALPITSLYIPLFGLFLIFITLRVGGYRIKNSISLGDGGDAELLKRIRGQANFIELVPITLLLIALVELSGAGATWVHGLYAALLVGRVSHYIQITGMVSPLLFRAGGMSLNMLVMLVASIYLLIQV